MKKMLEHFFSNDNWPTSQEPPSHYPTKGTVSSKKHTATVGDAGWWNLATTNPHVQVNHPRINVRHHSSATSWGNPQCDISRQRMTPKDAIAARLDGSVLDFNQDGSTQEVSRSLDDASSGGNGAYKASLLTRVWYNFPPDISIEPTWQPKCVSAHIHHSSKLLWMVASFSTSTPCHQASSSSDLWCWICDLVYVYL
jgi:hypothetical protein